MCPHNITINSQTLRVDRYGCVICRISTNGGVNSHGDGGSQRCVSCSFSLLSFDVVGAGVRAIRTADLDHTRVTLRASTTYWMDVVVRQAPLILVGVRPPVPLRVYLRLNVQSSHGIDVADDSFALTVVANT